MVFLIKILVHFTTILLNNRYNLLLSHIYKNTNQIQSNLINKCPSCCSRYQEFKPGRQITTQICCWSIIMYIKHFIEKIVALHLFKHQRPYLKGYLLLITRSLFSQKKGKTHAWTLFGFILTSLMMMVRPFCPNFQNTWNKDNYLFNLAEWSTWHSIAFKRSTPIRKYAIVRKYSALIIHINLVWIYNFKFKLGT